VRFEADVIDLLPELLGEDDPYTPIRETLMQRLDAGALPVEAVKQVAAELHDEGRREMVELGLLCLLFGVFD
jgi:hypothetical protein